MSPTTQRPSTRDRLLQAARDLLYAEGHTVSVDAIAAHAAVAKPTVYAHFSSKEALIEAALAAVAEQWDRELEAELARRAGDPQAQLMAVFDLLVAGLPDPAYHGCLLINSAATFAPATDHPARRALAAHHNRVREVFERLASDAGARRPADVARQLLLLYDGVKARGLVDHSGAAAADARAAAAALLRG